MGGPQKVQRDIPWQPPPAHFVKINCDGAVQGLGEWVGVGKD